MSYKLRRYGKTENWLTGSKKKAKYIKFNKINFTVVQTQDIKKPKLSRYFLAKYS